MDDIVCLLLVKDFMGIPLLLALLFWYSKVKRKLCLLLVLAICSISVLKILIYYILDSSIVHVLYLRAQLLQGVIALLMIPAAAREIYWWTKRRSNNKRTPGKD